MSFEKDKYRMRELAKRIAEEAASERQKERVFRYKSINALQQAKPPVAMLPPPLANNDLFPWSQVQITDPRLRLQEWIFLRDLKETAEWKTDRPVTNVVYSGLVSSVTDWMPGHKTVKIKENLTGSEFEPCIVEYSDLDKLQEPQLIVDHKSTEERFELMSDIMGDILEVRKGAPFGMTRGWGEGIIDELAEMRGLEQLYYDMLDEPEFVHEAMRRMTEGKLHLLKQYEEEGVLGFNNNTEPQGSCSVPLADELPGPEYDGKHISPKNLWGFAHAQEFTGVSYDMLEEFLLPYQAQIVNQFGLNNYGCCEPIDKQIDLIAKYIKNLRILSISPFADYKLVAEKHRGQYVMAFKPHPELLVNFDPARLEAYMKEFLENTQGCCVTLNFTELYYYDGHMEVFPQAAEVIHNAVEKYWRG